MSPPPSSRLEARLSLESVAGEAMLARVRK
jgi:hypothetical protein